MSKQPLILIDAGHGSLLEGKYSTYPDKRVEKYITQINEGVLNRAVASLLCFKLDFHKIPCHLVTPDNQDISLQTRVNRINKLSKEYNCVLISIHHNYFSLSTARGAEVFTSYGETKSDTYAEWMCKIYKAFFPDRVFRAHSKVKNSKEAGYYILRKTKCPAILTEFGFMSNCDDYNFMSSDEGINRQVNWLFESCKEIYKSISK